VYLLNAGRNRLLTVLPKGGAVAEIGVAMGGFAERIQTLAQPDQLHLIDPWELFHKTDLDTQRFGGQHKVVLEKFAADIESGRIIVYPSFSTEVASEFESEQLSWIYVDGAHDYDNVLADLRAFDPKIRADGFILGHDFAKNSKNDLQGFGVVRAVRDFIAETDWRLILLTQESAPTFMLARAGNTTTLPQIEQRLGKLPDGTVEEYPDEALDSFMQTEETRPDGKRVFVVQLGVSEAEHSRD